MSFFKKLGGSVSKVFNKGSSAVQNIFKKGGSIAQDVSKGLGQVSSVLGKVAGVGSQILDNPLTQGLATSVGTAFGIPEAGLLVGQAGNALKMVKQGSDLAGRASNLAGKVGDLSTAASQYQSPQDMIGGIQKAKALIKEGRGIAEPQFV